MQFSQNGQAAKWLHSQPNGVCGVSGWHWRRRRLIRRGEGESIESGRTIDRELGAESAQNGAIEPDSNRGASGECCGAGALAAEPAVAGEGGAAGDVVGSTDRSAEELLEVRDALESGRGPNP